MINSSIARAVVQAAVPHPLFIIIIGQLLHFCRALFVARHGVYFPLMS